MSEEKQEERSSSRNGTIYAYRVEARYNFDTPQIIAGQLLDNRWRLISFAEAPAGLGVPRGRSLEAAELHGTDCYGYTAAQALRWWFHAEADKDFNGMCLESRLVKYEIKYSTTWKPVSRHGEIGGDDRSNCMPDWGTK